MELNKKELKELRGMMLFAKWEDYIMQYLDFDELKALKEKIDVEIKHYDDEHQERIVVGDGCGEENHRRGIACSCVDCNAARDGEDHMREQDL